MKKSMPAPGWEPFKRSIKSTGFKLGLMLVLIVLIFALAISAMAGPFLACDCTPAGDNITGFSLQFGTAAWMDSPAMNTCGTVSPVTCAGTQKTVCYDLAVLPAGAFTVKIRAKNVWGVSADSAPFSDIKQLPSGVGSTRIVQ